MTKDKVVSCKYEGGMVCMSSIDCSFTSVVSCLQANLLLAHKEISILKEKRNQKHSKVSIKWRNNSFYYKKKLKYLELWMKNKGIVVPGIEEMFAVNLDSELTKGEGIKSNEPIRDSNEKSV